MWLWPLAMFEKRIQGGVAAAARLEIDFWGFTAGDKRYHQISRKGTKGIISRKGTENHKSERRLKKYILWSIAGIQQSSLDRER